jgi:hypothetical protein
VSEEIATLVENINASPEPLHADFTSEVRALVRCGLPAARAILPLLMSPDELTRLRAQRVLEGSAAVRWPTPGAVTGLFCGTTTATITGGPKRASGSRR